MTADYQSAMTDRVRNSAPCRALNTTRRLARFVTSQPCSSASPGRSSSPCSGCCGGTDADYPPPWLAAAAGRSRLVVAAFFAERVWLSGSPLDRRPDAVQLRAAGAQHLRVADRPQDDLSSRPRCCRRVIVGIRRSVRRWPIVIVGFPGILLLAWETWPTLRNVSRTAAMLDSGGAKSGLVEGFSAL